KYIFITGGVVSSLGKGITAASIGLILKTMGFRVGMLKIDPYLNVDPGTMSPYQHGEVFVTKDGAETDLDIGHYERFLNEELDRNSNLTSGQLYAELIEKERRGDYLGKTVQVVPHFTNLIKEKIRNVGKNKDITIVEIGGTVGDIEGLPFIEAIRQLRYEEGKENTLFIHISLVPYIKAVDEIKTKPTQHSVIKLRELGIKPDILICRCERKLGEEEKNKLSIFCDVEKEAVIEEIDVGENIYKIPVLLENQGLSKLIEKYLGIKRLVELNFLKKWNKVISQYENFKNKVTIGIAGKYTIVKDAYKSIKEALLHAGFSEKVKIDIKYIDTEKKNIEKDLKVLDAVIVPGGFGERGIEGKMKVARFAREKKLPLLGICLGMQISLIEMAKSWGLKEANSEEFDPESPFPVIISMPEQKAVKNLGGTMRLGEYTCKISKNTLTYSLYKKTLIRERHRHRYEFNNRFKKFFEKNGCIFSGINPERNLVEIVELKNHPFFILTQFHPEFKSRPLKPHPLFRGLVKMAKKRK
ncbi:MAG: CTP synthase, partial [Caldiserica bacterium]